MPRFKTPFEQEQFKSRIVELYVRRKTQSEIAAEVGLSQPAVCQWIRKIVQEWRESRFRNLDEIKFEELNRLNAMEAEMWRMWEQSLRLRRSATVAERVGKVITTPGASGPGKEEPSAYRRVIRDYHLVDPSTGQPQSQAEGNMQYWHAIEWCVDRRFKLLGLDEKKQVEKESGTSVREMTSGARDQLISKLEEIIKNRDKADRRPAVEGVGWKSREISDENVIDIEAEHSEIVVGEREDPTKKAVKRREQSRREGIEQRLLSEAQFDEEED